MGRPCLALSVLMSLLAGSLLAVGTAHSQIIVAVLELSQPDNAPVTTFKFTENEDQAVPDDQDANASEVEAPVADEVAGATAQPATDATTAETTIEAATTDATITDQATANDGAGDAAANVTPEQPAAVATTDSDEWSAEESAAIEAVIESMDDLICEDEDSAAHSAQEEVDRAFAEAVTETEGTNHAESAEEPKAATEGDAEWTWQDESSPDKAIDAFAEASEGLTEAPYEACRPESTSNAGGETSEEAAAEPTTVPEMSSQAESAEAVQPARSSWWRTGTDKLRSGVAGLIDAEWLQTSRQYLGDALTQLEAQHERLTAVYSETSPEVQDVAIAEDQVETAPAPEAGHEVNLVPEATDTLPPAEAQPTTSATMLLEAATMVESAESALHNLANYLRHLAGAHLAETPAAAAVR